MNRNPSLAPKQLFKYRRTGAQGAPIAMHRALRNIIITPSMWLTIFLLPVFFGIVLWLSLDSILLAWSALFEFIMEKLGYAGVEVAYIDTALVGGRVLHVPYPNLPSANPSQWAVQLNFFLSLFLFVVSLLFTRGALPIVYLLRYLLILQISASVYFYFVPQGLPYAFGNYITSMLTVGIYVMFLAALIFAMIYYIFDFSFWRKFFATAGILAYFVIMLPFQYMMHALIISSWSMLFMPTLYLMFGALLDILLLVSWYSVAMVWRSPRLERLATILKKP